MSTISELNIKPFITKKLTEDNLTYEELSIVLKQMFPNYKGFSVRSLQRYCSGENIHKTSQLNDSNLNDVVLTSVMQVSIVIPSVRSMQVYYVLQPALLVHVHVYLYGFL